MNLPHPTDDELEALVGIQGTRDGDKAIEYITRVRDEIRVTLENISDDTQLRQTQGAASVLSELIQIMELAPDTMRRKRAQRHAPTRSPDTDL